MTPRRGAVDVVVVAYNSRETLRECVAPLADAHNVIVVDNASPDDSAAAVAGLPVQVIRSARNGGFAYGCNLGIAAGDSEFVLLLNPDARLDPEGVTALIEALEADPQLGGAGPRLLDDDGGVAWSQRRFPRLRSTFSQALFLQRLAPLASWSDELIRDPGAYTRAGRPDWLSGACLLLRREALEAIGPMDEGFFLYSEETDLFRRFAAAGWGAAYVPGATAHHQGGVSAPRSTTKRHWAQSRVRYARKHHGPIVGALEAFGVALGALTHAALWIHRPERARGHADAGRAALGALRSALKTG
jgi:N-acetylglucosaminyl-diphospho-decaprenol L-rhamnosyltransferase